MAFKGDAREAFGEKVSWLLIPRDFVEFHLLSGCQLANAIDASVDVLGTLIHTCAFDQVDAGVVVLSDEGRFGLWIAEKLEDAA